MDKVGTRARATHRVWSSASVGGKPGPSIGARHKDAGKHERRPRPLAQRTGKEKERLFKRHQYGVAPELPPDAAEPDQQDVEDELASYWDMHNAGAPDDEDVGEEAPDLAPTAQVDAPAQAAAGQEETPAQKRLQKLQYLRIACGRYPP